MRESNLHTGTRVKLSDVCYGLNSEEFPSESTTQHTQKETAETHKDNSESIDCTKQGYVIFI